MISPVKQAWFCLFGPRLYKIHRDGPQNRLYLANACERWGDQVLQSLNIMWNITVYTSPLLAIYFYKKGYLDLQTIPIAFKYLSGVSMVVAASYCLRAYGRITNPQYKDFMKLLAEAHRNSPVDVSILRRFDFDFSAWPVNYDTRTVDTSAGINYVLNAYRSVRSWKDTPLNVISEIIKPIALKLTYPGSMSLVQMTVWHVLLEGRIKLVESFNGLRYKLKTRDNNDIDCMFVDRRNSTSVNGKILVIACEGNAGFYEIGVMSTPIEGDYSVLGWNHPGFGGSTGSPYPTQEHYAMDAVVQFAIHKLGFTPESIILYGWSIGGYSVAWAASQYPDIKGVFLDATFDDILPLAVIRMPSTWGPLVENIIRTHLNLNIVEILKEYNGPVKIVRRTMDEIITTEDGRLSTNRGNDLLIRLLCHRYPNVFGNDQIELAKQYLALQGPALSVFMATDHPGSTELNKKVFFLLEKYLIDYQSTHCTPLPHSFFQIPTNVDV